MSLQRYEIKVLSVLYCNGKSSIFAMFFMEQRTTFNNPSSKDLIISIEIVSNKTNTFVPYLSIQRV